MTMNQGRDQKYLKNLQYKDSKNLSARASLHKRFSSDHINWHEWVFDQLTIPEQAQILEIGCGPGWLWRENVARIQPGWHITLSDLSEGMVKEAREALFSSGHAFSFRVFDAQSLPVPDESLDVVIANHMLYHVPDLDRALGEIQRVLKPGGRFYAATNGDRHLHEIHEFVEDFSGEHSHVYQPFTLQNGRQPLSRYFDTIEAFHTNSELHVTEVPPLVDFITSWHTGLEDHEGMARYLEEKMTAGNGIIRITRQSGLFMAMK